jgi:Flp pilus assembly protein TadG
MVVRRRTQRRRGQVPVEAALLLPALLLVVFLVIECALYVYAREVVFGAAHEGAEVASADGATLDDGVQRATSLLRAGLGAAAGSFRVTSQVQGDAVVVNVHGELGVLRLEAGQGPLRLPLDAQARATRESFRARAP